jgi:hypothetical protein
MPPLRACNTRLLSDTQRIYRGAARHLPSSTDATVQQALRTARDAAKAGRCADMHKHTWTAREALNARIEELLGARRR